MTKHRAASIGLALILACGLSGCASIGMGEIDLPTIPLLEEEEKETPNRIIPVWTDSVLHRGGEAVRGFGGRVVFYGEETEQPIQVDGVVVVYAWNDSKANNQEKPDRKFVFKADMLPKHYSRSKIGDSYSFWLPWDKVGRTTQHVTLVTRFISAQGGEVTSTAAHVVLPGPTAEPKTDDEPGHIDPIMSAKAKLLEKVLDIEPNNDRRSSVRQISYEEPGSNRQRSERTISSSNALDATTINLPMHLAMGSQRTDADIIDLSRTEEQLPERPASRVAASVRQEYADRYVRDRLPVRSWRSDQQSDAPEQTQPDRSASLTGSSRQRSRKLTVQQKIAQDAAEAKARRDELWGQRSDATPGTAQSSRGTDQ